MNHLQRVRYQRDSPTGLVWDSSSARVKEGAVAGTLQPSGYYAFSLRADGRSHTYYCHRVVWELHNRVLVPGELIDHVNRIRSDNRIENLRLADNSKNMQNRGKQSNNASGVKGLSYHKRDKVWQGFVTANNVTTSCTNKCKETVIAWLEAERTRRHGEFAKGL